MTTLGNLSLLDQPTHGFLCSRTTGSSAILPCLDWAVRMGRGDVAVMSTFHSELERAVLDLLLPASCPLILVLGRSLYHEVPDKLRPLLSSGRLLILSLTDQPRITRDSAQLCNQYICRTATHLTFGFISPDSSLSAMCQTAMTKGRDVEVLYKT